MALTQRSTGGLTRVWARTFEGRLVSKKPEVNDLGWYSMDTSVDSAPAGLSYTEGTTQRQRVYYSRAGVMQQLNNDNEGWHGRVALPSPPAGTSFSGKAVAAVDWDDAGTRRTAVAAITTAGAVCVWQGTFTSGYASPICSANSTASTSNADIQGTVVGSTPAFFYRRSNNQLGSTARLFSFWFGYYWSSQSHGLPPGSSYIRESIAATPSLASSGRFEVVYTAVDQETGLMHLLTLEADISTTSETSCTNQNPSMQRMIYRRGWSASSIASMTSGSNLWVVGTGNADHENLVLTREASGTSAHVIWTGSANSYNGTRIWTLSPSGATSEAHLTTFPGSPSGLFADAAQDLYAWTFPYMAGGGVTGFATLCMIDPATGACSMDQHTMAPTGVGTTGPLRPTAPLVHFSRVGATHPYACGGGTVGESCFQTAEHFSFVAHPTIPNRLYAVYQGIDPAGGTSVYFTMHLEDNNLRHWTSPVRVNVRHSGDTTSLFVDSEITIDEDGAIIVTYTRVSDQMSGGTWAPSYIAVSTNDGASFSAEHVVGSWRPWDLPFHCSRQKHFLGEYRHPDVLGGRAFHAFHVSGGGNTILAGLLASRWAVRY